MGSKKKIARKWGKNHVPLLYDVHSDPWTDGPNHWNSGDFRCLKVDIGTRFHFRSFLIDFDEKYWSNGSKIWAGGIHPSPAYTSTKKPGQIRVKHFLRVLGSCKTKDFLPLRPKHIRNRVWFLGYPFDQCALDKS